MSRHAISHAPYRHDERRPARSPSLGVMALATALPFLATVAVSYPDATALVAAALVGAVTHRTFSRLTVRRTAAVPAD